MAIYMLHAGCHTDGRASSSLVLVGVKGSEAQLTQGVRRHRWRHGKQAALRAEAILVGHKRHLERSSVGKRETAKRI